jgi:imidazolonepropionase-like amidohydrolase
MTASKLLTAILVAVSFFSPMRGSAEPSRYLLIENVNLVDVTGDGLVPHMSVLIRDDVIAEVAAAGSIRAPLQAQRMDGAGRFLLPGLIDTHVHPGWHLDGQARIGADAALASLYLSRGVTGVRDASIQGQERQALQARRDAESGARVLPRIHVAGRVDQSNLAKHHVQDVRELTRILTDMGVDSLKIRNGLTMTDISVAAEMARDLDKPVWGHTYADLQDYSSAALRAGVSGITHVLGINPMVDSNRPEPAPPLEEWEAAWVYGATQWLHEDDRVTNALIDLMVERGAWLEPTLVTEHFVINPDLYRDHDNNAWLTIDYENTRLGFPQLEGKDLEDYRAAFTRMQAFVRRFYEAGGWLLAGTDNLPWQGAGLHMELQLLVDAGIPPLGALQAATINAAKALGWEDIGAIEPGMQADLVLLDANPLADIKNTSSIHAVITRGRLLSRPQLDAMLATAAD